MQVPFSRCYARLKNNFTSGGTAESLSRLENRNQSQQVSQPYP